MKPHHRKTIYLYTIMKKAAIGWKHFQCINPQYKCTDCKIHKEATQ